MYKFFLLTGVCAFLLWTAGCGGGNVDGASANTNAQAVTVAAPPAPTRTTSPSQPKPKLQQPVEEEDDGEKQVQEAQGATQPVQPRRRRRRDDDDEAIVQSTGTEEAAHSPSPQTETVETPSQPQAMLNARLMMPKSAVPQVRTSGEALALFTQMMMTRIVVRLIQENPPEQFSPPEEDIEQAQRPSRRRRHGDNDEDGDGDIDPRDRKAREGSRSVFGKGGGIFSRGKSENGRRRARNANRRRSTKGKAGRSKGRKQKERPENAEDEHD